jgi:hypothetical protein
MSSALYWYRKNCCLLRGIFVDFSVWLEVASSVSSAVPMVSLSAVVPVEVFTVNSGKGPLQGATIRSQMGRGFLNRCYSSVASLFVLVCDWQSLASQTLGPSWRGYMCMLSIHTDKFGDHKSMNYNVSSCPKMWLTEGTSQARYKMKLIPAYEVTIFG